MNSAPQIFDGHNDVLLRLFNKHADGVERLFLDGEKEGQLDFPRAVQGGFGGGMFAIFISSRDDIGDIDDLMRQPTYDVPLPRDHFLPSRHFPRTMAMAAILIRIERASAGTIQDLPQRAGDPLLPRQWDHGGGHAYRGRRADRSRFQLPWTFFMRRACARIGLVWSRPNIFRPWRALSAFRHPRYRPRPDRPREGARQGLQRAPHCDRSVPSERTRASGTWRVSSDAPLIATHSNAHAISPHSRNLTDRQLAAIRDSGGMVGINFATCFLRPDGRSIPNTGLDVLFRHLDHLVQQVGIDCVGFGSDFDGAKVPEAIGDVAGLTNLREALLARGFSGEVLRKLCHENWISVLGAPGANNPCGSSDRRFASLGLC